MYIHWIMIIISAIFTLLAWFGMVVLLNEPNSTLGSIIIGAYFASLSWFGASVISAVSKKSDENRHKELLTELCEIRKSIEDIQSRSRGSDNAQPVTHQQAPYPNIDHAQSEPRSTS